MLQSGCSGTKFGFTISVDSFGSLCKPRAADILGKGGFPLFFFRIDIDKVSSTGGCLEALGLGF